MNKEALLPYVAGIVDGEGYICYISATKKIHRSYEPRVGVVNTSLELMLLLKENFGGTVTTRGPSRGGLGKKTCYEWSLRYRKCRPFLELIAPFLLIKQQQAISLLALFSLNLRGESSSRTMSDERSEIEGKIYQRMRLLNGRKEVAS